MTARLVVAGDAPEQEWLEARRGGITASEIAVVMGLAPASWDSPYSLYWRKKGDLPEQDDSMALALGRHLEAFVACEFAARYPEFTILGDGRSLYAHPDRPWQLATPDRLIEDSAGCGIVERDGVFEVETLAVLECKTSASYDGWGDDGTDQIPVHYRCQALWQMDVMGVTTGYVACLFLHSRQLRVYELTMDDAAREDLTMMRHAAGLFLHRLKIGHPPPVDWAPATTAALKRLHPELKDETAVIPKRMATAWAAAGGRIWTAKAAQKRLENQMRERAGAANRYVLKDGTPVASRQVYDVREHIRRASRVDKLVPAKPPAAPTEEDPT